MTLYHQHDVRSCGLIRFHSISSVVLLNFFSFKLVRTVIYIDTKTLCIVFNNLQWFASTQNVTYYFIIKRLGLYISTRIVSNSDTFYTVFTSVARLDFTEILTHQTDPLVTSKMMAVLRSGYILEITDLKLDLSTNYSYVIEDFCSARIIPSNKSEVICRCFCLPYINLLSCYSMLNDVRSWWRVVKSTNKLQDENIRSNESRQWRFGSTDEGLHTLM